MEQFTVVIPTLDRCETLSHTLETCVAQQDDNFRILVSDNLSTDATREIVESFRLRDSRIELISPPSRMSMALHYEFALSHVTEGFFMLVGSDDGLLPTSVQRARACLGKYPDAQALHGGMNAVFNYPDIPYGGAGMLGLRLTPREEVMAARPMLEKVALGQESVLQLPYPYNTSWVRASLLARLVEKTGRRILDPIPDTYLSIALTSVLDNYVHAGLPFGIFGMSKKSTGASAHPEGDRVVEESLRNNVELPFHPKVGYSRCMEVLVGGCLLHARDAGLLPPDFPIAWERLVARAYFQFQTHTWSAAEAESNMAGLWKLSREFGCAYVLELAQKHPGLGAWKANLPFPLDTQVPWHFVKDTRPLGITGVHEAAKMAESVLLLAAEGAKPLSYKEATPDQLRGWCFNELMNECVQLRESLTAAGEANKMRSGKKKRRKSWLPKFLRRS